ncbi:MAG TPA: dihydroorotase [Candidatus Limnocylindrales bacterium]|nr:dihydroorotase [Candidatus Limnocylindrales bacterium]
MSDVAPDQVIRGWAVDPAAGREGPAELALRDGSLERLTWLSGAEADGIDAGGTLILPGLVDLHAHFREPGNEDAETVASGQAAAAHGGFTTVAVMPNTTPAIDDPSVVARVRAAAAASGSPVRVLVHGAVTVGRGGETLAPLGELADAGVAGFSDDGTPVHAAALLRNALAYAGSLGLPIIDHPEDPTLTRGAEASEGYVATVLGLKGWPTAAESGAVARAIALLADVVPDVPGARLHLTHVSTAASLAHVRVAKAAGLPVTCDVTPHHLAFADEWIAGARRWAWEAVDADGSARDPWTDGALVAAPFDPSLRVNPPLRAATDAAACLAALADGTADAIATDHAPHTEVDKHVEFGWASNGISGIETALPIVLAAVDAGQITLARAVEAMTTGPARILGERQGVRPGLREGAPADLVVVDRGATWTVTAASLRSKGKNSPLLGRELRGVVRLTLAAGRVAYSAD